MRLLANGNIEVAVVLSPESYAMLRDAMERSGQNESTVINAALGALSQVDKIMSAQGEDLFGSLKEGEQ